MGLWRKGFDRSRTGENRMEDVRTSQIKEFKEQVSTQIVDDKNWIVKSKIKHLCKEKKNKLIIALSIISLLFLIIIIILSLFLFSPNYSNSKDEYSEYKVIPDSIYYPSQNWQRVAELDVFGEPKDNYYHQYDFNMKLPTGIRGGELEALFKIKIREGERYCFKYDYVIVISPDSLKQPKFSYGYILYLWYKEEGRQASDYLIRFDFEDKVGYRLSHMQLGNYELFERFLKNHKLVKFKGFTSDYLTGAGAKQFIESPNGIGREGTDVFINPEFTIQF